MSEMIHKPVLVSDSNGQESVQIICCLKNDVPRGAVESSLWPVSGQVIEKLSE